ncbi:MAG: protease SohB [Legionellales bacterium]|nr:protease SohB [Legionellales bacterium]
MEFLTNYGLFLLQTVTLVAAILVIIAGVLALATKGKHKSVRLKITSLNERFHQLTEQLSEHVHSKPQRRTRAKQYKKQQQQRQKHPYPKCFVLQFKGDIKASAVESLRQEITAVLSVATQEDQVLVCLESPGGLVHAYGLAAAQLTRIKAQNIPLTICIDHVAASGGYMMACVADKIIAAPFAIIGSIGVVGQMPNFHRLLKKHYIDYELLTAGQFKRTLTVFGHNTEQARQKFQQDLEDIHQSFKAFITQQRPTTNINRVATGEHWLASQALELQLVDELATSDQVLTGICNTHDILQVRYQRKATVMDKLTHSVHLLIDRWFTSLQQKQRDSTFQ